MKKLLLNIFGIRKIAILTKRITIAHLNMKKQKLRYMDKLSTLTEEYDEMVCQGEHDADLIYELKKSYTQLEGKHEAQTNILKGEVEMFEEMYMTELDKNEEIISDYHMEVAKNKKLSKEVNILKQQVERY